MTPDEFIQFLTNTPPHGYANVVKITHIHSANRDVTNRVYKTYEHSWSGGNFISKVTEGISQRGIGTFNKMEWNESDDILTKYLGVNDIDSTRHNTPERMEFESLVSLGIRYLDHSSVRKEGSELYAEVYQPESPDSAGVKRRLRGRFNLYPDGNVKQLECTVYLGLEGERKLLYGIIYRFDGAWGNTFPHYLQIYRINDTDSDNSIPDENNVFEEKEITDWNIASEPAAKELNPDLLFSSASQVVLSNNIEYSVQKARNNVQTEKLTPVVASAGTIEDPTRQKRVKLWIRSLILIVASVPVVIWAKRRSQITKSKNT